MCERSIRRLKVSDLDACWKLDAATWNGSFWCRADYESELIRKESLVLGAFLDSHPGKPSVASHLAGLICVWTVLDEGHVLNLVVDTSWRSRGVGTALLVWAKEIAEHELGLAFLTLEVRAQNQGAVRLYERNGFHVVGRRKKYYHAPDDDAILMTWNIHNS
ncbi:putative ribosomal-protein-alanine acetyltransferase [Porphyridium purpureum]|uniref:Putative ribosomal-protein-alanine acetyltransferase n=1 Tax=Porphyridium purpureum TaxID=35688 RepID=A0A5J4Z1Z2_PORPP|nr:putative ribosomal-protein-alanine acetyltransferase [Porphyridium purpureum]|eukprot:POR7505..scf295_1